MEGWSSLCFIALSTLVALWFRKSKSKKHLPPGPWCLPIIGSLHHLVSAVPHRKLLELSRRHGPLMLLRLGEVPTVVVSTAEAAALVMKTNDLMFASRPRSPTQDIFGCSGKSMLFAPYGAYWRQMRKVCTMELLSSKQVKRMEGVRAEEVGKLIRFISDAASTGATVNVSEKVRALANDVVSRAVYRGKFARQDEYLREMGKAFALLGGPCLADLFPSSRLVRWLSSGERQMRRSCDRMHSIVEEIIQERVEARAAGDGVCSTTDHEDLLDVLLRLQQEDSSEFPLTTEVMRAILFDMFGGGTESSGTALEWAMSELIRNPEAMAKAQQEIRNVLGPDRTVHVITNSDLSELQYMRMFLKEVLRLHPPAPFIVRTTREDCKIMVYDMIKGTTVLVNNFAVSTDPKYWENPEEFNPERFVNNKTDYHGTYFEFTPFGAGRRQCPGILFATSTLEIAFANLLYHFNWVLPGGGKSPQSLDMSKELGITVGGRRYDLQLRAIPHICSKSSEM